jgi:hypothetical protein
MPRSFAREAVAGMIRANAADWHGVLTRPGQVGRRPSPVHHLYDVTGSRHAAP